MAPESEKSSPRAIANLGKALTAASTVVIADQTTKSLAQHYLKNGPIHVLGPISFRLIYNSGVAFSLGTGHPAIVTLIAVILIGSLLAAAARVRSATMAAAFGLVLGGALGNLADRIFRPLGGSVVDFIYTGFWATFNVADACIVIGCIIVALRSLRR